MNDLTTLQAEDLTSIPVTDSMGNMTYKHEHISDLSLYDDHCQIGKAPLEAYVPYVQHDVEFSEPRPLPGFSALYSFTACRAGWPVSETGWWLAWTSSTA
jgi:hypothetical protein